MKKNKSICLNMIVKDEAKVIERCLASVKPFIDYWVISDTGSTDGTQEKIRSFLKDIPGELMERPWVDFSHNRNEVLYQSRGKGDFLLFIDADEWLDVSESFVMPNFEKDCYVASVKVANGSVYRRVILINNHIPWEWKGVLHEDICPEYMNGYEFLEGVVNVSNTADGSRSSHPKKYQKDAAVLKEALDKEPDNCRYAYYLAQSYEEAQENELALDMYIRRSQMIHGWEEEVFYSYYKIAQLQRILNYPSHVFIDSYCKAFQIRPTRAEPLFHLAHYYLSEKNFFHAYLVSQKALKIPRCIDCMLVEHPLYDYAIELLFAECAVQVGQFQEACEAYERLQVNPFVPLETKEQIRLFLPFVLSRKMTSAW
ncbi:MAG: glycosyltransferase [Chlamydiales bacterium]|nr:glycosyltransferase [Chlamydiales bacterium]